MEMINQFDYTEVEEIKSDLEDHIKEIEEYIDLLSTDYTEDDIDCLYKKSQGCHGILNSLKVELCTLPIHSNNIINYNHYNFEISNIDVRINDLQTSLQTKSKKKKKKDDETLTLLLPNLTNRIESFIEINNNSSRSNIFLQFYKVLKFSLKGYLIKSLILCFLIIVIIYLIPYILL